MSYVFKIVRPVNIQAWIAANAPGSLRNTARESWRAYLQANSGTGQTIGDLERSFLNAQAIAGSKDGDRWSIKESGTSGGSGREKVRNKYR
jgi:hypothetical protein